MGLIIEYHSKRNRISYNNFINNTINGYLIQAFRNKWNKNYWDDWIGLKRRSLVFIPKIIKGVPIEKIPIFAWVNFDFNPSENPYVFD